MNDQPTTILLVDDDSAFRQAVGRALERRGYTLLYAQSGDEALRHESLHECDAAVIDLRMPGMDGLTLLKELKQKFATLPVIVLTGHGTISTAIDAIRNGAFHYLTKPCDIPELEIYLQKAVDSCRVLEANRHLRDAIQRAEQTHGIVGDHPAIQELLRLVERVKDSDSPALVIGESGTGKELVARALHFQSKRKEAPFIAINCATLKPELLENELFGHVSGAFTGATARKEGLLVIADQGTLFVDEIADMNPNVQASLLRVIESGEFRPLGSTKEQKTNVRILAAANRDLAAEVQAQRFREDLFYRLSVLVIKTPPLRQHLDDVPLLVNTFLNRSAWGSKGITFSDDAIKCLQQYDWPGNIRELFNICERAVLLRNSDLITASEIQMLLQAHPSLHQPKSHAADSPPPPAPLQSLDDMERDHIRRVLAQTHHNISKTAEILGIDRRTLQRKMDRYGLDR